MSAVRRENPSGGRFVYCDVSLRDDVGHYANVCRAIAGEARRRGLETLVFGADGIAPLLASELGAAGLFRYGEAGDWPCSPDHLVGWLDDYETRLAGTREDLGRLPPFSSSDTIFVNSALAPHAAAVLDWAQERFTPADCPAISIEMPLPPGIMPCDGGYEIRYPEAYLYRLALRRRRPEFERRIRLSSFDPLTARDYGWIAGSPVEALPQVQRAGSCRSRVGAKPVTVAFLGHQRRNKGFHMVPGLVERILLARPDARVLVHNCPGHMDAEMAELSALAEREARITLLCETAGEERWRQILDASDLIVLPYNPARYARSYSAVAAEAIGSAIPLVVPAGTSPEAEARRHGGGFRAFTEWTPDAILGAVLDALDDYEALAAQALAGAARRRERTGPVRFLDQILGTTARIEEPAA